MSKQTLHMGAAMNIPQVLGYTRIAGTPVVTGLYTVLLPLVAFAVFGSSRHLVVAAILIVSLLGRQDRSFASKQPLGHRELRSGAALDLQGRAALR